jgi:tetratricopeptide (TPR) repeat protein
VQELPHPTGDFGDGHDLNEFGKIPGRVVTTRGDRASFGLPLLARSSSRPPIRRRSRALALVPSAVEGRLAMGEYYAVVRHDHMRAFEQYEVALRAGPASSDLLASLASEEASLGRWDQSIAHFEPAQALDPLSLRTAQLLAFSLLCVRRYPQPLAAADRALALAPSVATLHIKVVVYLAQGDLATARQVIRRARTQIDPASLVSFFAAYFDLYWVLDEEQQALLLRLTPRAFGDNRAVWGDALAATYALRGDSVHARAYADSARLAADAQVRTEPDLDGGSGELGVANAYLGRHAEAIRAGERAVALRPVTKDATTAAHIQHQLARIYLLVGEPEKALDQLEPLLKIPYYLSPAWLKIDPTFAPLRVTRASSDWWRPSESK